MDPKSSKIELLEKEIEELKKEKKTLVSIVSHDLKSPFNRIYALTNLMKMTEDSLNEEQKDYMAKMHQVVKDGLSLIKNLLDVRALENKGISQEIKQMDVIHLIKSQMKALKPIADIKGIKMKFNSDEAQLEVTSDKQYLSRIVDNLLSNAIKFSESGSTVNVTVRKNEKKLLIKIKDEGPGISKEDQKLLYNKYQKLTALPTDGESATGLGLFITKSLVDLLNGSIQCKSKLESGTEFIVGLPIKG